MVQPMARTATSTARAESIIRVIFTGSVIGACGTWERPEVREPRELSYEAHPTTITRKTDTYPIWQSDSGEDAHRRTGVRSSRACDVASLTPAGDRICCQPLSMRKYAGFTCPHVNRTKTANRPLTRLPTAPSPRRGANPTTTTIWTPPCSNAALHAARRQVAAHHVLLHGGVQRVRAGQERRHAEYPPHHRTGRLHGRKCPAGPDPLTGRDPRHFVTTIRQ